jgi:YbbR domain-containing protein
MKDSKAKKTADNGRTFTIIISVVIALILWSYVIIQVNPTKEEVIPRVPVKLLNVQSLTARQLAILGDGEYVVDVVVEGRRADIGKVKAGDIVAEADLHGWTKGENYIPVNVIVPSTLKHVEARVLKIQVTIEDLVAVSMPVGVYFRGNFPVDTEEGEIELRPSEIEVTGAKSAVEEVEEIRIYVDVENLTSSGTDIQSEVQAINHGEMNVDNIKLSSNYVNVSAKLLQLKEVPLIVETTGGPGEGFGVEIDVKNSIFLKGTKAALKNIESVKADPVDISKIFRTGNVTLNFNLPEGVELSKRNLRVVAGIRIEQTGEKQFSFSENDILMRGLTQGKTVNMEAVSLLVTVSGRKEIVELLQQDQIQPYIDVENLSAGVHTVSLMASMDVPLHSVSLNPDQITIEIIDKGQESTTE